MLATGHEKIGLQFERNEIGWEAEGLSTVPLLPFRQEIFSLRVSAAHSGEIRFM